MPTHCPVELRKVEQDLGVIELLIILCRPEQLQRTLQEWLGCGVLASLMQVGGGLVEESPCLCEPHTVTLNSGGDGQGMGQQPATERPVGVLDRRESTVDSPDGPLGPQTLGGIIHGRL